MCQIEKDKACCFFGHRKIEETPELKTALVDTIEDLIINKMLIPSSLEAKVNLMPFVMMLYLN